jgi:3',5'-cyclic AMP phosphodiesterase CpdA
VRRVLPLLALAVAALGLVLALFVLRDGDGDAEATGILAIGDFGVRLERQQKIGTAMRRFEREHSADVLVTLGDNDYSGSPRTFRRRFRASFGWASRREIPVHGILGNHDIQVNEGRYQYELLGMPDAYYTRTIGDVQLLMLNSNDVSGSQTAWLRGELEDSDARWRIALVHDPAYTCGNYRSNPQVVESWVPLFERYGVQLVLSGDDHNYQRFEPRGGVTYVVSGNGGRTAYDLERCPAGYPKRRAESERHGFLYLEVRAAVLSGLAVDEDEDVIDRFAIYP